jgi:hypothetical protein
MAKLIGTDPNQVPTNADLGTMAYQDSSAIRIGEIQFPSHEFKDVNNGVAILKTVGTSSTDVVHITVTAGGYSNYIFEVYGFSSGNNMPAKATILARGYSGGWSGVEIKDEQLGVSPRVDLGARSVGADLIISATQVNSSTLTIFVKSIYRSNASITAA